MKSFIETHLGVMLTAGAVLGLLFPAAANVPQATITIMLGIVIFLACLRIQTSEFHQVAWGQVILFWLARFVGLPVILFGVALQFLPDYASAVLLLALLPAGASSPAFTNLFGGNVPTALFLTLLSSAGSVAVIPLLFDTIGHMSVTPPAFKMFVTLAETILLPAAIGFPLRGRFSLTKFSNNYGKAITVIMLSSIVVVIVASQRQTILFDPKVMIVPMIVAVSCYAIFIAAGLPLLRRNPAGRIALFTCSAFNNTVVGFTLALIDFPHQVILTIVMAQFCWVLLPLATGRLVAGMRRSLGASLPADNPV